MELGAGIENETLQNLIRDCLLELNRLKFDLTELEIAKARDTTPQKIQELENHILNKEKEVSLIKFKAEDEISLLKKQLEEKDALIKNQEDRIYELDYVNNSLDEIKEYFAEQLRDYKKKELAEVNERLNESFKSIAEKDAQINTLSRTIDDYKIQVIKLENNAEFKSRISDLERELEYKNNELSEKNNMITAKENEVSLLRESTIPKDNYINLQKELSFLRESTIPKEDYISLQKELSSREDKIKRLEEINNFFNELQEEQEAYETMDRTPPFRLEKKRFNKK
ncbi:glycosyl transferase [Methanobrevibacter smithii]|uniref:glycosyl transferase n=1 Tax=Methanobrevibacter smithii TaxID=2173 RepID=UPI0037DC8DDC